MQEIIETFDKNIVEVRNLTIQSKELKSKSFSDIVNAVLGYDNIFGTYYVDYDKAYYAVTFHDNIVIETYNTHMLNIGLRQGMVENIFILDSAEYCFTFVLRNNNENQSVINVTVSKR